MCWLINGQRIIIIFTLHLSVGLREWHIQIGFCTNEMLIPIFVLISWVCVAVDRQIKWLQQNQNRMCLSMTFKLWSRLVYENRTKNSFELLTRQKESIFECCRMQWNSHDNQIAFGQIDIVTLTSCIRMIIFKSGVISPFFTG